MADYIYVGRRGAGISPTYESEVEYPGYGGDVEFALVPASGGHVTGHAYVGRRGAETLPASAFLLRAPVNREYIGWRGSELLPDSPVAPLDKFYVGSIEHGWIPDFIDLEATFAYAGSIALAVTPGAGYGAERSYVGSIEVVLTPESAAVVDAVYSASIAVALTPAVGTALLEKVYSGTILCTLRPISDYEGTGVTIREYTGNIPVSLLPQIAEAVRDAVYSGTLPLALAPKAGYESASIGEFEYSGFLPLTLLPISIVRLQSPIIAPRYKRTRIPCHIKKTKVKDN